MSQIVNQQAGVFHVFGLSWATLPRWNFIPQFPAFCVYVTCALAETNRPPFDLAEAESELVAGFHTEYSGIGFAMFYLGEYLNAVTVSAIAVTLFLGGWRGPFYTHTLPWVLPLVWFVLKLLLVIYVFVLIRGTLPRMRYDRLMNFGWKVLIPAGLVWVLATGAVVVLPDEYGRHATFVGFAFAFGVILVVMLLAPAFWSAPQREEVSR